MPNVQKAIRSLAKIALGSFLGGPLGGVSAAANEAIDYIYAGFFEIHKADFNRIIDQIIGNIEELVKSEGLSSNDIQAAASNTEIIFQKGNMTASDWIESKLESAAAAEVIIDRNLDFIKTLGDPVESLCIKLVHTVCPVLLSDKSLLSKLDLAFKQTILDRLDALPDLPQRVADVLKPVGCNALLTVPNIEYSDRIFSPSFMLRADCGIVPYYPREEMTVDLEAWCEADSPIAVRLYTGPAGMGKTRFFIETCRSLRKKDWRAGFLSSETANVPPDILDALIHMRKRLFIVIDYAERRRPELVELLKLILIDYKNLHIRLILIARSAEDWWLGLKKEGEGVGGLLAGPATTIIQFPPLGDDVEERKIIFDNAVEAFAEKLETNIPDFTHPNLGADHFRTVLFIHMSALAAALGETIDYPVDLLDFVLGRERDIWRKQIQAIGLPDMLEDAVGQYVVLITLARGATDRSEAIELSGRVPLLGDQSAAVRNQIAKLLRGTYPGNRWVEGLLPDLLGEHFVQEEIRKDPSLLDAAVVEEAGEDQISNALTVLTRLSARYPDGELWLESILERNLSRLAITALNIAIETGGSIGHILAEVMKANPNPELAERVMVLVPIKTLALRELGVLATKQCLEALLSLPDRRPVDVQHKIGGLYNNLSNRLGYLGRWEEALHCAQQAAMIYRQLAEDDPNTFLPNLATSLNNLATCLSDLGNRGGALKNAQQALKIQYQLVKAQPDIFLPSLASSLHNFAKTLSDLGRKKEALKNAQEAVMIRHRLAKAHPDVFLPDLAMSLLNFAVFLDDIGYWEEALQNAQGAVTIQRQLVSTHPDAFLPDLAMSLDNLANRLSALDRLEEAIQNAQEALTIRYDLVKSYPDAFLPDLASSLNNLASLISSLGRRKEALQLAQEAVTIYRQLVKKRPYVFLPNLATVLHNLAKFYSDLGYQDKVLNNAQEAVMIRRQLVETHPEAFLPDLASSLSNLAKFYSEQGCLEEAFQTGFEAVEIRRQLVETHPDAFLPDLAVSLHNLASFLNDLGHREEALQCAQEVLTIYRLLIDKHSDVFLPDLAASLSNIASFLRYFNRWKEAIQNAQEAVKIRRQLAEVRPDAFLPDLAMSLGTLAICLEGDKQNDKAFSLIKQAIEAIAPLFLSEVSAFTQLMTKLIEHYTALANNINQELDMNLLKPIFDALNSFQCNESKGEE